MTTKALALLAVILGYAAANAQEVDGEKSAYVATVSGEGTEFAVRGAYPDFKLISSDRIKLSITVDKNLIVYTIQKAGKDSNVAITLQGLPPGLVLYRHVDDRPAERPLTADEKGVMRYREEVGRVAHVMLTSAKSTKYQDVNLTLTADLFEAIVVTADDVTIDGNGFAIHPDGMYTGIGVSIAGHSRVTIKNLTITGFLYPVRLQDTGAITVENCTLEPAGGAGVCVFSERSAGNRYINNTALIKQGGFWLWTGTNDLVQNCVFNFPQIPPDLPVSPEGVPATTSAILASAQKDTVVKGNSIEVGASLDVGINFTRLSSVPVNAPDSENIVISGNRVSGAKRGISFIKTSGTLTRNTLNGTEVDLRLGSTAVAAVFQNNFLGSASPKVAVLGTAPATTELSSEGRGNWWGRSSPSYFLAADTNNAAVVDTYPYGAEDAWVPAPMSGTYEVGTNKLYPSPAAAAEALVTAGQSGPVVFDVYPGPSLHQMTLGAVVGNSSANTVVFRKAPTTAGPVNLGPVSIPGVPFTEMFADNGREIGRGIPSSALAGQPAERRSRDGRSEAGWAQPSPRDAAA